MKYSDLILHIANDEFYHKSEDKNDPYWTMKDGTKIPISHMETSHIKNTLNLLRKKSPHGFKKWAPIFMKELSKRK